MKNNMLSDDFRDIAEHKTKVVNRCKCGSTKFIAHQRCYHDNVVDSENNFLEDLGVYESEESYGPYVCLGCNVEYDDLDKLTAVSK